MLDIPVFRPLIEAEELQASTAALELGWLGMGEYVGRFEETLKTCLGADDRFVVAVSTGHAALHLGLMVAGVGPGDEVITPSFNNIADFQAILAVGAEPVFCDIDPTSLCIDLGKAEALVSPRTKAFIAMDYDCLLCDHDGVRELAETHALRVIHDAAHSLGSTYRGAPVGSFSDISMFSFDPVKTITCIDGGALVVRTPAEQEALHQMRLLGMGQSSDVMYQNRRAWTYDVSRLGYRYHMANLHAAIGLAQLAKLDVIGETRRQACRLYNQALGHLPGICVPATDFQGITPFLYYLRVADGRRDALRAHLKARGIDTGIHWQPAHWFTLFQGCRRGDLSVTDRVGAEIVSLPLHSKMAESDVNRVIDAIDGFANGRYKRTEMVAFWSDRAKTFGTDPRANTADVWLREIEVDRLSAVIDAHAPSRILDFGCANGHSTIRLACAHKEASFVGLDVNADMIEAANLRRDADGVANAAFVCGDLLHADIGTFDLVMAVRVFQNMDSLATQKRYADRLADVLRPGGLFVCIESYAAGYRRLNADRVRLGLPPLPIHSHLTLLTGAFDRHVAGGLAVVWRRPLGSSYYLITRLAYSHMAQALGQPIDYDHPLHQVASRVPDIGSYGPMRIALYRKHGGQTA